MNLDFKKGLTSDQLKAPVRNFLAPVDTVFSIDETVGEALAALREKPIRNKANYFYGLDQEGQLVGIVSARDLLFTKPETPIANIVNPKVIKLQATTPLKEALNLLSEKQLLALPVVNQDNQLEGIIEIPPHRVASIEKEEALHHKIDQDIFQMIGITLEQAKVKSMTGEYKYRMPWLLCNILGGLLCAGIAGIFERTLDEVVILALFIPLVLSLSESVAMQSMTLSLQFMHERKIALSRVITRTITESKTSLLLGLTSAVIVGVVYLIFNSQLQPLGPITISILLSMIVAALLGTLIPIGFHVLKWDPKVAAGPIVLTLADIVATITYLGLATLWLKV